MGELSGSVVIQRAAGARRRVHLLLAGLDVVLLSGSAGAATCLRYDFHFVTHSWPRMALLLVVGAGTLVLLGGLHGLYTGRWVRGSFEEARALAHTAGAATIGLLILDLALRHPLPLSAMVAAGPMAFGSMAATRVVHRLVSRGPDAAEPPRSKVVVFGAGGGGSDVIRAMLRDRLRTYEPTALLDDDPAKAGLRLHGVPVRGTRSDVARVARETCADTLLIAVPSAGAALIRDLTGRGTAAGLLVKVLPPVTELFEKAPGVHDIRPVGFADLMGRHEVTVDLASVAGYVAGRRVLVTGAGGSIGSELCRQLRRHRPSSLVMLDRDESALHTLELSLEGRAMLDAPSLVVADIRDRERMERVFVKHAPEIVFHAAALKHLPLLEMHPSEAVKTNILGTLTLLDVASRAGVRRFVNISTDKAADPISVLGYSKRIAERLTSWYDARANVDAFADLLIMQSPSPGGDHAVPTPSRGICLGEARSGRAMSNGAGSAEAVRSDVLADRRFLSVRFGNVLGSRGSVLTAFARQIEDRHPLSVTHPDVTRYFMTVEEAVRLVIHAGGIGAGGEALVLDMGEPVRIVEVARRLIEESGLDLGIEYTGLRPGEKLHECLLGEGERDVRPVHPRISQVLVPPLSPADVSVLNGPVSDDELVARLRAVATAAADRTGADQTVEVGS